MSRFQSELVLKCHAGLAIDEKPYEVVNEFVYRTDHLSMRTHVVVPPGYRTDFASIPRFMWRILPPGGRYREAAVIHDYLCDVEPKICDHDEAALVFAEAMAALGVRKWKRHLMTWAVRKFGPRFVENVAGDGGE